MIWTLPVPSRIRKDHLGDGHFGARRSDHTHEGIDLVVEPGQLVIAPTKCHVDRIAMPYPVDFTWSGLQLSTPLVLIKIFYIEPLKDIIGKDIDFAEPLGYAQDIRKKYPSITPHIHFQVGLRPFAYYPVYQQTIWIDPNILFEVGHEG